MREVNTGKGGIEATSEGHPSFYMKVQKGTKGNQQTAHACATDGQALVRRLVEEPKNLVCVLSRHGNSGSWVFANGSFNL